MQRTLSDRSALCLLIERKNGCGKKCKYEYKYRMGGKTLCALYAKENSFGFMIILGEGERNKFEMQRELFGDIERLLQIKRKPDRKTVVY